MNIEYVEKALFPWVHSNKEYIGIDDKLKNKIYINDRVKYLNFHTNERTGTVSKFIYRGIMRYVIIDDDPTVCQEYNINTDIIEKIN